MALALTSAIACIYYQSFGGGGGGGETAQKGRNFTNSSTEKVRENCHLGPEQT